MKTESPFSNIPSQLDNIPEDAPIVFISYSWDSDEHKQWVSNLSKDLREKFRVNTLLDQYNRGGDDVITFMTKGLKRAHRVLIIGTPKYKEKIEKQSGGARFEDQVITTELYHDMGSNKFVPLLREGSFADSFSELIETRTGYDMSNDANYENVLMELAADLWGCPINTAPALGPKPNFMPASQVLQPLTASTPQDFATIVKSYLLEPSKQIFLTELIEDEREEAFNKILKHASYNRQTTPQIFDSYLSLHQEAIAKLMSSVLPIVRYGNIEQQRLLVDAIMKLCTKPFRNGEITVQGAQFVHLLASIFLYHATGVASIKYGRFDLIKLMMQTKVPAPNVFSSSSSISLEYLAGCNHWEQVSLNTYLQANWIYPYSHLIMNGIKTHFLKVFFDENDFQNCFYTWEHMASLLCNYYKCQPFSNSDDWFYVGAFVNKRVSLSREEEDFYTDFFRQSEIQKEEWAPIKCGLFEGKYENFVKLFEKAESFYKENRYYYLY